jgi:DNA ligase-1
MRWVSEKLDGIRALWDGKKFVTRTGYVIDAPTKFSRHFPKEHLDGELW